MLTILALSKFVESELSSFGIEESECRAEAQLILTHCSGLSLEERLKEPGRPVLDSVLTCVNNLLSRRKEREPLQYCLGETYFFALRFLIRPGVLIPRPDTETIVQATLSYFAGEKGPLVLGEIGTGSGIISVVLLKQLACAKMVACDISPAAVELARANAELHGILPRLTIACRDWHDWLAEQDTPFDAIVANPPYIARSAKLDLAPEVGLWEPEQALFGPGEDGLGFYRDLAGAESIPLKDRAPLILEIGCGQASLVQDIFCSRGWQSAATAKDLNGTVRVLSFLR
jgi:release factor glutamine methyltransferase